MRLSSPRLRSAYLFIDAERNAFQATETMFETSMRSCGGTSKKLKKLAAGQMRQFMSICAADSRRCRSTGRAADGEEWRKSSAAAEVKQKL